MVGPEYCLANQMHLLVEVFNAHKDKARLSATGQVHSACSVTLTHTCPDSHITLVLNYFHTQVFHTHSYTHSLTHTLTLTDTWFFVFTFTHTHCHTHSDIHMHNILFHTCTVSTIHSQTSCHTYLQKHTFRFTLTHTRQISHLAQGLRAPLLLGPASPERLQHFGVCGP